MKKNDQQPGEASHVRDDDLSSQLFRVGQHRDQTAFAKLFAHFAPLIKGFCIANSNATLSDEMAEELVQEVMLKVWTKAPTFDPSKAAATTWIYTVMRNARIDLIRRSRKHPTNTDTIEVDDIWDDTLDHQPLVLLQQSRSRDWIEASFNSLPQEQQHALAEVYVLGKSHQQIAVESGLPLGTVKSRVRMGLKKLQASLRRRS